MALIFKNAEDAKNAILASQKQEIADLYKVWADDISKKAYGYAMKTTPSSVVSEVQMKKLYKSLHKTSEEISNEIQSKIMKNMYLVSDAVVKDNINWLKQFGFSEDGLNAAFNYVPDEVIRNLVTGQIYQGGWNLSARIWSDNAEVLKDTYQIVAKGLAENQTIQEIAKNLEAYVNPDKRLPWNPILAMRNTKTGEIEYKRIYKGQVDYNAQRLARTLVQHSYQQSFIAVTQKNPFILDYIWHSNGSRVCELCNSRDGKHFKKDELPMDHPNGMCTMEPNVADDMVDQLADWFNSPEGTYPEIDEFASNFGYEATKVKTSQDFISKYGMSKKSPNAWFNSLTPTQKAEAKMLKEQSGLTWKDWYEKNIYDTGDPTQNFIKKYGMSDKSPNAWYNSISATQKAEAKLLKEQSGLTWQKWYEQYIYSGTGSSFGGKVSTTAAKSLDDALAVAQKKFDKFPGKKKKYSGIWVDDVTAADYESKISSIPKKKEYYEKLIEKYSDDIYVHSHMSGNYDYASQMIAKFQGYLDDLEDFETKGKAYLQAKQELEAAKAAVAKAKGASGVKTSKFTPDAYTAQAKKSAKKFTSEWDADKFHRPYLDKVWDETSEYEHYSVWEYTQNSNPINKSLSGYHDGWSRRNDYVGLGKADLGHENMWRHFDTSEFERKFGVDGHKDYKTVVEKLTKVIDKSEMQDAVFVVRGSDEYGLAGLLDGDLLSFDDALTLLRSGDKVKIKAAIEGQVFTNHAYTSTGISTGTGFSGNVKYEIFMPKGTHAIYAEPTSYYGGTVGMREKLYKVGQSYSSIGSEAEVIIQRGTDFRITSIDVDRYGDIKIQMEVVNQPDYFKTGLEHTHNGGKTVYEK